MKERSRCYCVDWNVEVNGRKLLDHKVERENAMWNVTINGRTLMDNISNDKLLKPNDPQRVVNTIIPKTKKSLRKKLFYCKQTDDEKIGKKIVELIRHDNPDIDKRLLRLLVLLRIVRKMKNLKALQIASHYGIGKSRILILNVIIPL